MSGKGYAALEKNSKCTIRQNNATNRNMIELIWEIQFYSSILYKYRLVEKCAYDNITAIKPTWWWFWFVTSCPRCSSPVWRKFFLFYWFVHSVIKCFAIPTICIFCRTNTLFPRQNCRLYCGCGIFSKRTEIVKRVIFIFRLVGWIRFTI